MNKLLLSLMLAQTIFASQADIMQPDSVTVYGKIQNFVPDTIVTALTIEVADIALDQKSKRVIPIQPDGSFRRTFLLPHAQIVSSRIYPYNVFGLYLEPGENIGIELDNNTLSRQNHIGRNIDKHITFSGSLAQLNSELAEAPEHDVIIGEGINTNLSPEAFKDSVISTYDQYDLSLERYAATLPPDSKAPALLRATLMKEKVLALFDYADFNDSHRILPREYYRDFTRALLHSDSTILMTEDANTLLNRLGYAKMLPSRRFDVDMATFHRAVNYIIDNGGEFTPKELQQLYTPLDSLNADSIQTVTPTDGLWIGDALYRAAERIGKKDEVADILSKKINFAQRIEYDNFMAIQATDDDWLRKFADIDTLPPIWQYAVSARDVLEILDSDTLNLARFNITYPPLINRLETAFDEVHGENLVEDVNSPGLQYFKELIAPFSGKYLLIDFWDLYCGPCRADIESSLDWRNKYSNSPDFDILFLASEDSHPDGWAAYNQKLLDGEASLRLERVKSDLLRELFNFNAIPRYVIVAPSGRIINTNGSYWEFKNMLGERGLLDD